MSARNLLTDWASLVLGGFAAAGVTDVVISPGSRSTPFVLAAVRTPGLRCHDVIDERAAAFFALGQARVTGRPSLLLCTSGTAAAHYLPAVIEAGASYTPMLILTADRPFELQDCAAAQTIDQVKLFGDHARRYIELGVPDAAPTALRSLRRVTAQAELLARSPLPGAVHINARARKPLDPSPPRTSDEIRLHDEIARLLAEPAPLVAPPRLLPDSAAAAAIARLIRETPRGLLVCGPAPIAQARAREAIFALAAASGYPLLCEGASQVRFAGATPPGVLVCDGFDAVLRSRAFREQSHPDLILQIGAPPTSGRWDPYLAAHPGCLRAVIAPHGWNDPQSTATAMLFSEVREGARALCDALAGQGLLHAPERSAWSSRFAAANASAWRVIESELASAAALSEAEVARAVVASLPRESMLAVGNSLAIRAVDTYARGRGETDALVLSQRGANGIDGLISGAAGAASASGKPLTLLLGDVSFLHDMNGLMLARGLTSPFVVVVLQNDGGRIFEQLPLASTPGVTPAEMAHMTTPHGVELAHAAALFGHRHVRVDTRHALSEALAAAHRARGCTVIEAVVPPHGAALLDGRLNDAIERLGDLAAGPIPPPRKP